jgi:hypothetical protein
MNQSSWTRRIRLNNHHNSEEIQKAQISEMKSAKKHEDSKNIKDKLNLKPIYIKPTKDILEIIPFCNNIYTIQRMDI